MIETLATLAGPLGGNPVKARRTESGRRAEIEIQAIVRIASRELAAGRQGGSLWTSLQARVECRLG